MGSIEDLGRFMTNKRLVMSSLVGLLLVLLLLLNGEAFESGAPEKACNSLHPGHIPYEPQDPSVNPHPFVAEFSRAPQSGSDSQDSVLIRISGEEDFTGFIAQVQNEAGSTTGQFTAGRRYAMTLSCFGESDTITHNSGIKKNAVEFTWRPTTYHAGKVRLNATMAKTMKEYWTNIAFDVPETLIEPYNSDTQQPTDAKHGAQTDANRIVHEL